MPPNFHRQNLDLEGTGFKFHDPNRVDMQEQLFSPKSYPPQQRNRFAMDWEDNDADNLHSNHNHETQSLSFFSSQSSRTSQPIYPSTGRVLLSIKRPQDFEAYSGIDTAPVQRPDLSRFALPPPSKPPSYTSSSSDLPSSPIVNTQRRRNDSILLGTEVKKPKLMSNAIPEILKTKELSPKNLFKDALQSKPFTGYNVSKAMSLSHVPTTVQGIHLVPITSLPDRFRSIFPYPVFNGVQSRSFDSVYGGNDNIVLSSPTGSGKTVILELAICKLISTYEPGTFKIIYQAPTKALCAERRRDWEKKLKPLGLKCKELTGDTDFNQVAEVKAGDVIITTPEKWDSMTRRWHDHRKLLELVRLFLIDEVHLLREDRGATLEVVVSRMKLIGSNVRFIALSATLPNSKDLCSWLGKDSTHLDLPAHEERFGEEFRPVKLQKFVYGYDGNSNDFAFEKVLNSKLPELIAKHGAKKPVMVFCPTRKSCVETAKLLAEKWQICSAQNRPWLAATVGFSFRDRDLQCLGNCGVAFHHAGIEVDDRALVEKMFLEGHLSALCCTSTLAVGINLSVHMVIIKNTVTWRGAVNGEYSDLEVLQMLSRAGRPQFEDTGVAVIMTRREKKGKYEKMLSGMEKLESCLHENLVEHMNAEIGLKTITDMESAKQWLRSTFLYVRMKQNPEYYQISRGELALEAKLEKVVEKDLESLERYGIVETCKNKLKCSELGDAMARYYIKFETMQTILELKEQAKASEILTCLSNAREFKDMKIRQNERATYRDVNKSISMKWPIKETISTAAHKVNILVQFEIGQMELPIETPNKHQIIRDKTLVFQHVQRIIRCIIDCKLWSKDSISVRNGLMLARCLSGKAWENSPSMLRQLSGIGSVMVKRFVNSNIKTIEMLGSLDAHQIERIASKNPPWGTNLKKDIGGIPSFRLQVYRVKTTANGKDPVKVQLRADIRLINTLPSGTWHKHTLYSIFLAETSDGKLLDFRRMPISKMSEGQDFQFEVKLTGPEQDIVCHLYCENIVGTSKTVDLKMGIEASKFPKPQLIQSKSNMPTMTNKLLKQPGWTAINMKEEDEYEDLQLDEIKMYFSQVDKFTTATEASLNHNSDEIEAMEEEHDEEPKQRPDGKWECNHKCSNKTACHHYCCNNGMDRPSKKKAAAKSKNAPENSKAKIKKGSGKVNMGESLKQKRVSNLTSPSGSYNGEILDLLSDDDLRGPKEVQKLNKLHGKTTEPQAALPKQGEPQFKYESGKEPKWENLKPLADDDDDSFPSLSQFDEAKKESFNSFEKSTDHIRHLREPGDTYSLMDDSFIVNSTNPKISDTSNLDIQELSVSPFDNETSKKKQPPSKIGKIRDTAPKTYVPITTHKKKFQPSMKTGGPGTDLEPLKRNLFTPVTGNAVHFTKHARSDQLKIETEIEVGPGSEHPSHIWPTAITEQQDLTTQDVMDFLGDCVMYVD